MHFSNHSSSFLGTAFSAFSLCFCKPSNEYTTSMQSERERERGERERERKRERERGERQTRTQKTNGTRRKKEGETGRFQTFEQEERRMGGGRERKSDRRKRDTPTF